VTLAVARAASGWALASGDDPPETLPPTAEELRLLREELDPEGAYLR
jgi:glutaconate CoA-transferase subunit B